MDRTRKTFFWQGGGDKKKYHLVKWIKVTKPKTKGGPGVKDMRKMNISLLCKWWWKLENEEGLRLEVVRKNIWWVEVFPTQGIILIIIQCGVIF
jgi:hypothetical protein